MCKFFFLRILFLVSVGGKEVVWWVCFDLVYLHIPYFKGDLKDNEGSVDYTQFLC